MKQKDGIGLSFLDMLSCGLGGMILLFMIFATFQHQGVQRPGRREPPPELSESDAAASAGIGEVDPETMPQLWLAIPQFETQITDQTLVGTLDPLIKGTRLGRSTTKPGALVVFIEDPKGAMDKSIEITSNPDTKFTLQLQQTQPEIRHQQTKNYVGTVRITLQRQGGFHIQEVGL